MGGESFHNVPGVDELKTLSKLLTRGQVEVDEVFELNFALVLLVKELKFLGELARVSVIFIEFEQS